MTVVSFANDVKQNFLTVRECRSKFTLTEIKTAAKMSKLFENSFNSDV